MWDIERGKSDQIEPFPWQTDNRSIYERNAYTSAGQVVQMLIDIVSKNGNLLLNIPLRGDGSIDSREVAVLAGVANWMTANHPRIMNPIPANDVADIRPADARRDNHSFSNSTAGSPSCLRPAPLVQHQKGAARPVRI